MSEIKETTQADKVYERILLKTIFRICGFLVLVFLDISLFGSLFSRLEMHQRINWALEAVTFLVVLFFNFSIVYPIIFELRKIQFWRDHIKVNTLFWSSSLEWKDIVELKEPLLFKILVLKTKRCSYVINKSDYPQIAEILEKLKGKIGVTQIQP